MKEGHDIKIINCGPPVGGDAVIKIWFCGVMFLLVPVLLVGCSSLSDKAIPTEVPAGQISPHLQAAVQRLNELFLQAEGKPRRQFTGKRMLPDGGSETTCFWIAPGGMKATKPGIYEMNGVNVETKVSPSGESKTEHFDVVTCFTTNPKNRDRVVCYSLIRPQDSRGNFELRGPWDVKLVGSDGIWIGHSFDMARRVQAGAWLSHEWHAMPSGKVHGIRQYLGEPGVTVTETSTEP